MMCKSIKKGNLIRSARHCEEGVARRGNLSREKRHSRCTCSMLGIATLVSLARNDMYHQTRRCDGIYACGNLFHQPRTNTLNIRAHFFV